MDFPGHRRYYALAARVNGGKDIFRYGSANRAVRRARRDIGQIKWIPWYAILERLLQSPQNGLAIMSILIYGYS